MERQFFSQGIAVRKTGAHIGLTRSYSLCCSRVLCFRVLAWLVGAAKLEAVPSQRMYAQVCRLCEDNGRLQVAWMLIKNLRRSRGCSALSRLSAEMTLRHLTVIATIASSSEIILT